MCFDGIVEYSVRKRTDAVVYIRTQYVSTNLSLFSFFFSGGWGACLSFLWLSASDFLVHFVFVFIIIIFFFSFGYWRCEPVSDAYTSR
jgi:hypothetical protein